MSSALLDSLKRANLLPSAVIPSDFTPSIHLAVQFPTKSACNGTLVRVSEVQTAPTISISSSSSSSSSDSDAAAATLASQKFTLMLIDPDAPTPDDPQFAYWRHWVVTNIPWPSLTASPPNQVVVDDAGRTLTPYLAPGPNDESGPHRYLFLLFLEPEQGLSLEKGDVGGEAFVERRSFGAGEFVQRHGLRLAGVQWMRGVGDGWVGEE
ncbi:phosphatidylethanolamine-binding protein [Chaetomidium leptoderma]|uniref:Phosphatidylethanolamine-binding protein n=1 Tax=Chaetomidium leptoderma TaxID=669021 RepID=A0AAN6VQE0_9PEZI|nr:phosphatidylethanolamine-binding protein [Chaetomidium leptoderma]